jgi:hypothetical protein
MNSFHGFFEQMKMQMIRQKDLKKSLDSKLKEISNSESKIYEMYKDIQGEFKSHIGDISKKITNLETSNYDINQRLFSVEKDIEKDNLEIKMNINGIKLDTEDFIKKTLEGDCENRSSCNVCVDDPRCVWCGMQKRCTLGTPNGPSDGSCMNSFEYGTCSQSTCDFLTNCVSCIQNQNCGWCGASNICMDGSRFSPDKKFCRNKYIHKLNGEKCYNLKKYN